MQLMNYLVLYLVQRIIKQKLNLKCLQDLYIYFVVECFKNKRYMPIKYLFKNDVEFE